MFRLILFLSFSLGVQALWAQTTEYKPKYLQHDHEFGLHGGFLMRGFNLGFTYGEIMPSNKTRFILVEFAELRSAKERRKRQDLFGTVPNNGQAFIYGKQNNFYTLRLGVGQKVYFSESVGRRGVNLAYSYSAGFNLGMLKPYYLKIIYRDSWGSPNIRPEAYNEENRFRFLDPTQIEGPAGFSYGWGDLRLRPGIFLRSSLWIDLGEWDDVLRAFELGLCADVFARPVPIMVDGNHAPVFFNLFLNFHLGGRWKNK